MEENQTENINYFTCFCCGEKVKETEIICPKCGASFEHLEIPENRNPYTNIYLGDDGTYVEGNAWDIWGAVILIFGIGIFFIGLLSTLTSGVIIASLIIAGIGIILLTIGSYRKHKGKEIVRKENEIVRETDSNFTSKEDDLDGWDKAKKAINSIKNRTLSKKISKPTLAEELRDLKKLLDENIITQEEFDKKKHDLLNKR